VWRTVLDTAADDNAFESQRHEIGAQYPLQGRALVLLVEAT